MIEEASPPPRRRCFCRGRSQWRPHRRAPRGPGRCGRLALERGEGGRRGEQRGRGRRRHRGRPPRRPGGGGGRGRPGGAPRARRPAGAGPVGGGGGGGRGAVGWRWGWLRRHFRTTAIPLAPPPPPQNNTLSPASGFPAATATAGTGCPAWSWTRGSGRSARRGGGPPSGEVGAVTAATAPPPRWSRSAGMRVSTRKRDRSSMGREEEGGGKRAPRRRLAPPAGLCGPPRACGRCGTPWHVQACAPALPPGWERGRRGWESVGGGGQKAGPRK